MHERFDAFISYRQTPVDKQWAKWLHGSLERFRTPRRLVRSKAIPPRLDRVFRDADEMSAQSHLGDALEQALRDSRYLIVVCSPRTPDSKWVTREITFFQELGRHDRILALLVEGEPSESFPEPLRELEPVAADVRPQIGKPRRARRTALLRLVSTLLGCEFDELRQRDRERRQKRIGAAALASLVLIAGFALLMVDSYVQRKLAEQRQLETDRKTLSQLLARARADLADSRPGPALSTLYAARVLAERIDEVSTELRYLQQRAARPFASLERAIRAHEGAIKAMAYSPNGTHLVTAGEDRLAYLWKADSGERSRTLKGHTSPIVQARWAPSSESVATLDHFGSARKWDLAGQCTASHTPVKSSWKGAITWSGTTATLFSSHLTTEPYGHEIRRLELGDTKPPARIGHVTGTLYGLFASSSHVAASTKNILTTWKAGELSSAVTATVPLSLVGAFNPSADVLAVVAGEPPYRVRWIDPDTGALLRESLAAHRNEAQAIGFSPDGSRLATAGKDGRVLIWDTDTGQLFAELRGHKAGVGAIAWSADGRFVASGDSLGRALLWDPDAEGALTALPGHTAAVTTVAFSPRGDRISVGAADGTLRTWSLARLLPYVIVAPEPHALSAVHRTTPVSADGAHAVTVTPDGKAHVWDLAKGSLVRTLDGADGGIAGIDPRGRYVATVDKQQVVRVREIASGDLILSDAPDGRAGFGAVQFSADGTRVLVSRARVSALHTLDPAGLVHVFDYASYEPDQLPLTVYATITADARHVLTVPLGGGAESLWWNALDGKNLAKKPARAGGMPIHPRAVSDAGLAVLGPSGFNVPPHPIVVWSVRTDSKVIATVRQTPNDLVISPSGESILASMPDGTCRVWTISNGSELVLRGPDDAINHATFVEEGEKVICASDDRRLTLFDARDGHIIDRLSGHRHAVQQVWDTPHGFLSSDGRRVLVWPQDADRSPSDLKELIEQRVAEREAARPPVQVIERPEGPIVVEPDRAIVFKEIARSTESAWTGEWDPNVNAGIVFSRDGALVLSYGGQFTYLYRFPTGEFVWSSMSTPALALAPNSTEALVGTTLVSTSDRNARRRLPLERSGSASPVGAFTPDGERILFGFDRRIELRRRSDGEQLWQTRGHDDPVRKVTVDPNGVLGASGSKNGTLKTWTLEDGTQHRILVGHRSEISALTFLPDGSLVSGDATGETMIWDLTTSTRTHHWKLPGAVRALRVVDGDLLAAANDGTIARWNLSTRRLTKAGGQEYRDRFFGRVYAAAFSPDGRHVLFGIPDIGLVLLELTP